MTTFAPGVLRRTLVGEPESSSGQDVMLRLQRPSSSTVVIRIAGELDAATAPRLHELLAPRLSSMLETVILDLSELRFMGVAGLELIAHARRRASGRDMLICIVDGPVCVDRALRAAGWSETVPTFASVEAAMGALHG